MQVFCTFRGQAQHSGVILTDAIAFDVSGRDHEEEEGLLILIRLLEDMKFLSCEDIVLMDGTRRLNG